MRLGSSIGIVLGVVVAILVAITSVMPTYVVESTTRDLCLSPEQGFSLFNDLEEVARWSTMIGSVPDDERHFEGTQGEGAKAILTDGDDQWIHFQILESQAPEHVVYAFRTNDDLDARATVNLAPIELGSRAELEIRVDFSGFLSRWARLFLPGALQDLMRDEFAALEGLLAERGQACEGGPTASTADVE